MRDSRARLPFLPFLLMMLATLVGPGGATGAERPGAEQARRLTAALQEAERAAAERKLDVAADLYGAVLAEAGRLDHETLMLARAMDGLAVVERDRLRLEEAATLFARAIPLLQRLLGPGQPRVAVSLHNLGLVRRDLGQLDEAESLLGQALGIWEAAYGSESGQAENTRRALRSVERLRSGS